MGCAANRTAATWRVAVRLQQRCCETLVHMLDDEQRTLLTRTRAAGNEPEVRAEKPKRREERKSSWRENIHSSTLITTVAIGAAAGLVTASLVQQLCQSLLDNITLVIYFSSDLVRF